MNVRMMLLLFFAVSGVYFLGRGGFESFSSLTTPNEVLRFVSEPMRNSTPIDMGIAVLSMLLLVWVVLLGKDSAGVSRATLLRSVGIASGLIGIAALAANFLYFAPLGAPRYVALVGAWGLLQSLIGIGAAAALLFGRESRGPGVLPLALNACVLLVTATLFLAPIYR